ncbi:conserved protein of unknown function [Nitrosotalea devaniterrae]|uniref:Uncharacterized protein n=1 Tax=Nitrosotalea devaniterrae TaxID=1078905 RepID=A0A128A5J6_9ARCH|nr:conserved protein of unknown function [Candidatus Nitrosotalea devanaterra]
MCHCVSSKDESIFSKEALLSTKPGKDIVKQALFKSKGYKLFDKYKKEAEEEFPKFTKRFAEDLLKEIKSDPNPFETQERFAKEVGSTEIILQKSQIDEVRKRLENYETLLDRVSRILNSNFVKMTFPVFSALYDASTQYFGDDNDSKKKTDIIDGHIIAIDLSEPMDRIMDKDEDVEFLDDYKLMNPYILKLARDKISIGGKDVLEEFERGFKDARVGQYVDFKLKMNPKSISEEEMIQCYKKYRAVMGTAGKNMTLARFPLGEIFYLGMAKAAESVGCGNEIEDSIKNKFVKVPSWPLYYTFLTGDVQKGFDFTMKKSDIYLGEARLALELLPESFSHKDFLEFLFLTVEHYNLYWFNRLSKEKLWKEFESKIPQ